MKVYRITKSRYAEDLSGSMASRCGGRWHPKGLPLLYTSESASLAALHLCVSMNPSEVVDDLVLVSLSVSAGRGQSMIEDVDTSLLPEDIYRHPFSLACQQIGRRFLLDGQGLGLRVPSSLIRSESHILLNPSYADFHKRVKIEHIEPFML